MTSPGYKGQRHGPPIRGNNPTPLREVRNEMRRLMGIMIQLNKRYLLREEYVRAQHAKGSHNFSGDVNTVLKNDLALGDISGGSKTVATLIQACSAYIVAELAMRGKLETDEPAG